LQSQWPKQSALGVREPRSRFSRGSARSPWLFGGHGDRPETSRNANEMLCVTPS
jgi:hypothetical protein